jgi:hypothetical protein
MIGGTDIVIPTGGGHAPLDLCLRVIRRYWPEAVFEDALTGDRYDRYESLPTGRLKEVLVYQDGRSAKEWDEKGADPSLGNTMIHLLLAEKSMTVVVDDPAEPPMREVVDSIQFALASSDGFNDKAPVREAHPGTEASPNQP